MGKMKQLAHDDLIHGAMSMPDDRFSRILKELDELKELITIINKRLEGCK